MIYFIRSGIGGPIKIGVSRDPHARLAQLQCGSATRLHLMGNAPGGYADEAVVHRYLADERIHGEHFEATPRTLELIIMLLRSAADALEAEGLTMAGEVA